MHRLFFCIAVAAGIAAGMLRAQEPATAPSAPRAPDVRYVDARGVCVDIDPQRIAESRENARLAGVTDRIEFRNEDLLTTDLSSATVIMLFLSPELNLRLRPRLLRELKPGTRVVSHWHDMGNWKPLQSVLISSYGRSRYVYLWSIPER